MGEQLQRGPRFRRGHAGSEMGADGGDAPEMTEAAKREFYIMVDVEASGPSPSDYAMLAIGASTVSEPRETFYIELQPDRRGYTEEAMRVCGLSLDRLDAEGTPPADAMQEFADWIERVVPDGARPVLTALNAPFDWMFVNDYFHRYLGWNPFGHAALDIKAFCMGQCGVPWHETSYGRIRRRYLGDKPLAHNALEDAVDEAELFEAMLADREASRNPGEES